MLWAFTEDKICEVHPYAPFQISDNFIRETFHTNSFNAREFRIPFLGCRSVNRSVQWLDVTRPFGETGIATAARTENLYVYPWGTNPSRIPNVLINRRTTFTNVPINLRAAERRARDNRL